MTPRQSNEHPRLERLLAKGRAAQWSLERDIDWDQAPAPTRWLPRRVVAKVVSQVYYGELATQRLCRQLLDEIGDPTARACLELQIADESRHAEAYRRYLERLGDIAPIDPAVALALDAGPAAPGGTIGKMVACHLVLESEALTIQEDLSNGVNCPLLRSINRLAAPDEARHVAFGRFYLTGKVEALPLEQRLAIYDWVKDTWRDCAQATVESLSGYRVLVRGSIERRLAAGWQRQMQGLEDFGLVPAARAEVA